LTIPLDLRASLGKLIINLYIDKEPRTPIITPSLVKVIDVSETGIRVKKKKNKFLSGFGIFGTDDRTDNDEEENKLVTKKIKIQPVNK